MNYNKTIAEQTNGIIIAEYKSEYNVSRGYQTEAELEKNFISDLVSQGYEYANHIRSSEALLENLKVQIEKLNNVSFTESEWERFNKEYLNAPNDGKLEKTRKIQDNYIYDFLFDDGYLKNIKIIDKKNLSNNYVQVINQLTQKGSHTNRYDVTILVNGLPLVQVELKKRGVSIAEAFNQVHRYEKESFSAGDALYEYIQVYVISNGTNTRYFANTVDREHKNFEFTCEWADFKNNCIRELEDFTATFFNKKTILEVITKYSVFNARNQLMIMRPYQIAATERILQKINTSYQGNKYGSVNAGGFVWHTTGSGKTLTSFKTAKLATELEYIDKVFFVVDRKDLDYQTMKEYQNFQPDSVNGSSDTKALKKNIEKEDNRIVVTTIQKLNEFIKSNPSHEIYNKHCVLIFDECHRSQFGEAQKNITKRFKKYYQFGFTGTPIFSENSISGELTSGVFGEQLHSYVITDAIRDGNVLKFKIDYNSALTGYKDIEEGLGRSLTAKEQSYLERQLLMHPDRFTKITKYILDNFARKTNRSTYHIVKGKTMAGFNAMFAVQSVDAAKYYYEEFEKQQANLPENKRLKVATIYSYAANEEQTVQGEIEEENFTPTALTGTAKEFLEKVVRDYNETFKTNFSIEGEGFQNYYKDLAQKVKEKEVDLLIVVGMFLTGFDAPTMNTLFVDKNLRYHGLIQAFSRTNRILSKVKPFGNIVCFRDLEKATDDAISLFGDKNSINIIKERSFKDHVEGYTDEETGIKKKGYIDVCNEMLEKYPNPTEILSLGETAKKEFIKLFGEVLKFENILRNFDEFYTDDRVKIIPEGMMQDFKSVYIDLRVVTPPGNDDLELNFDDVEFQIELLKTEEINLDYILNLIYKKSKEAESKEELKEEISRTLRTSIDMRAKEGLVKEFIDEVSMQDLQKENNVQDEFYKFARRRKKESVDEVIVDERLKEGAENFINRSIDKGYVNDAGTELDDLLPSGVGRRGGIRQKLKQKIFGKIKGIVDIFKGI
ncbi:MAG: type I restriction endonuclease subunit R [Gemella sp.]|nr:type I restriction endonuclease subunit R [Gemella sp.]